MGAMAKRTTTRATKGTLLQAQDAFIASWGQMGSTWGISRTMAEIHALLYISDRPMYTDEVMERLKISRGNASMSLRALVDWGIVSRVHKRGDRKEYFTAEQDVWTMLRRVVRERLRREIHPVLASLFEIRDMTRPAGSGGEEKGEGRAATAGREGGLEPSEAVSEHNARLDELLGLMQIIDRLGERFAGSDGPGLQVAASVLAKVVL